MSTQKSNVTVPLRFSLTTANGKIFNIVYSVQGHNECAIQDVAKIWGNYIIDKTNDKLFKLTAGETFLDAIARVHKFDLKKRVTDSNWCIIADYLSKANQYCANVYGIFDAHVNICLANIAIKLAYGI